MTAPRDGASWQDPTSLPDRDEMLAPSTQIVTDRDAYLGQGRHDVGRRISDDQVELFASVDAASALSMEFRQHDPSFIAIHDVGTSASLRLLNSLAGAMGASVQRLSIRRQGHGLAMAVLQFVEMPMPSGPPVRIYSSDISADGPQRTSMSRALLANSRLGVMLMGSLSQMAMAAQMQPFNEAVQAGPWPNRELLMVPLGSGVALAAHASQLAGRSGVAVHVTPQAAKTRQAWAYIAGAWNRLNGGVGGEHAMRTEFDSAAASVRAPAAAPVPSSEATTEPMGLHADPAPPSVAVRRGNPWQSYVDSCVVLKGAVACCVFDTLSMHELAHAGPDTTAAHLAEQGARLLRAMSEATRALGLGHSPNDGSVSVGGHHLLVRPVPGHPGTALHMVLSAASNLTLARMQLERITPPPPGTPHPIQPT